MSNNKNHTDKKKRRKWPWIIALCLVGIIGLARLSLMTGPVHRWVKNKIIDTANNQLAPRLSIGKLSGDLWHGATLTDITLTDNGEAVVSVDTVHLEYGPLSYFSDAFQIHEIRLVRPFIILRQQADSTWNVQEWSATTDTTQSTFTFSLSNFLIKNGRVDVHTIQVPQDSSFVLDDLNLASSLAYYGDKFDARIQDFNFNIKETRFDAPVSVQTAATADEKSVTLDKLMVATAHTLLKASGQADLQDSTGRLQADATPLGWKDLAAYMDEMPVQKDVKLSLNLSGDRRQLQATLSADAEGINQLSVQSNFDRDSVVTLSSVRISANKLDLETFLGDTTMPRLQSLDFSAQGWVPLANYRQGRMEGTLSAANLQQGAYQLDALHGTFSLKDERAKIQLEPVSGGQRLIANANIGRVWDESPSVFLRVQGNGINPARWLQDEAFAGSLSFNGEVSGTGWSPGPHEWSYLLTLNESTLMDQMIDSATFSGRFNQDHITNKSRIDIARGRVKLQVQADQLQKMPQFSYTMNVRNIDLSGFRGLEEYPSVINGSIEGKGRGNSLQNLQMQAKAQIDSSLFKGESIDQFTADARLADSVLMIEKGGLASSIADAGFSGKINISNIYDNDNKLNIEVEVKDLSSFASVADVDILQATGRIEGELKPAAADSVVFDGMVALKDVNYDNRFIASGISGGLRVDLDKQPRYLVDFDISDPRFSSVSVQNIRLKTEGKLNEEVTNGSFSVALSGKNEGSISQAGTYRITADTSAVVLTSFNLTSSLRTLSLGQPFHATYANGTVQTDTLHIASDDASAFMELAVPYADSLHQKAYLKGKNLNLAVIQNAALDKAYLEGVLFGKLQVDRTDTSLVASSDLILSDLKYEETELDTLQFRADIKNERLTGMMELHQKGELIAEGDVDILFEAKAPGKLEDDFFQKPVSGHLKLYALNLDRFSRLLQQMGYEDTKGLVQFDGSLEGQAGQPRLNAKLSLTEAELSGVPIDSLIASVNYRHEASNLDINATLTSLKQKALQVDARMPLNVDLRRFEVALPGPQDSISVDVKTNNFDVKALNDFMNPKVARNLEGRINGNVKIRGPRNDLQTSGQFTLQKGAVRVVQAGIRLDHIESNIQFEPDRVVLSKLHMESGKGSLNGKGELALEQLVPGDINVSVNAKNFKAANTDEYNALVNLNLNVGGSMTRPKVTGKLEMINGFIELDNFGEKSVETIELDTTKSIEPDISFYDSLSIDMDIEFNRRFFVRNQRYLEMEIELDGQIDVLKDAGKDLQLFGTLNTSNGYARPLGKRFELEEGSLAFSGPPDNPQINVRTLYEPPQANQEVKIWYIIEGTVEDPQFKYESQPPMDLAGIISYTLFGQPFYKLNPSEQSVASSSSNNAAADFAMEVLLDRVEALATKRLGIDVVRIENTRVGGESGTSVTTGWYINPKVFFAIQNVITGSTPTTGFYLEYYLKKNLKLILSQGNDNRQGVDIQWEHDY